jgi:hypothetical protein
VEELGLGLPLGRGEALEGLQAPGVVVGVEEQLEVSLELVVAVVVVALRGRVIRSTWPFVHGWFGLVSRCSISLASQIMSKRLIRERMVFRLRGCSANWMP